jgi:hypothetical protein
MKKHLLKIMLSLLLVAGWDSVNAQTYPPVSYLWGASPFQDSLWSIDTTTLQVVNRVAPSLAGFTITGITGMAFDPCGGQTYVIMKVSGVTGRVLGTIQLETGVCTQVGNLGDNFSSIIFDRTGQLFGVTGNGATVPETFYSIDKATAAKTLLTPFGNGADGEIICYDPVHDMFYHWSGNGTVVYEKFANAAPYTIISISTGGASGETFGAMYVGPDKFLISNIQSSFNYVDTLGNYSVPFSSNPDDLRGLVMPPSFAANTDTICAGIEQVTIAADAVNLYSVIYNWGDGSIDTVVSAGATHTYAAPGAYTISASLYTGYCSPSVYWSTTIQVNNIPSVALSGNTVICPNDSVLLTGSSGGSSQWYLDGTAITGATTSQYWASVPGNYNMVKTNLNGCGDSAAVGIVLVNGSAPVVDLGPDTAACVSYTIDAQNPGATYLWNTAEGTQTITVSSTGDYSVVVTDSNFCSASDTVSITINALPVVTLSGTDTICAGDSSLLTGSSGGSSQWYLNGALIPGATSPTYFALQEGVYNMVKTNANGCADSAATGITLVVNNLPVVTITGNDTICSGDSTLLSGSSGGTSQWYFNGTVISGANSSAFYASQAGVYNLVKTNSNGCSDSAAAGIAIVVLNSPVVTLSGGPGYCAGGNVILTGSSGGSSQWYLNGNIIGGATSNTYSAVAPGIYNMVKTNTNGCADSADVGLTIVEFALPVVTYVEVQDTVCISLGQIVLSPGAPVGGVYSGVSVVGNIMTLTALGSYQITYSYTDTNGCSNIATSPIVVDQCIGLNEISSGFVEVYPNPSNGIVRFENNGRWTKNATVSVFDSRGSRMLTITNWSNDQLDFTGLSEGIYFIRINDQANIFNSRLVILK